MTTALVVDPRSIVTERMRAALVASDPAFTRRNQLLEKLERIGVDAEEFTPAQVLTADLSEVNIVIAMRTNMSHSESDHARRGAQRYGKPCVMLSHKVSDRSWEVLLVALHGAVGAALAGQPGRSPRAQIAALIAAEADSDEAPESGAVVANDAQAQDDARLAAMYAKEAEDLRLKLAQAEQSRDNLSREVGRLTTALDTARRQAENVGRLGKELEGARVELKKRAGELTRWQEEVQALRRKVEALEQMRTNATRQASEARAATEDLRAKLKIAEGKASLADNAARLQQDVAAAKDAAHTRDVQLADALKEVRKLRAELAEAQTADRAAATEIARLHGELGARSGGISSPAAGGVDPKALAALATLVDAGAMTDAEAWAKAVALARKATS